MIPGFDWLSARREFLFRSAGGFGSIALSWLMQQDAARADVSDDAATNGLLPKKTHLPARARSIIFFNMEGGASQVDTFDPKPALTKYNGTLFQRPNVRSNQVKGNRYFVGSPFQFAKYGECGMEVSELFSQTARCVDDIAFVRSVYGESDNHPAAIFQYNTGFPVQGNPSVGAWMTYGLGSENQNLPAFVVLRDGKPFGGTSAWGNGFLPALYHGTQFRGGENPVLNLSPSVAVEDQRLGLDLIQKLNRRHDAARPSNTDLDARISAFELAFRMQTEIPLAVNLAEETLATQQAYGLDRSETKAFGRRCLLARRLVERGVRFIQIWSGGWDSHADVANGQREAAERVDQPLAALLTDLKQRGLLDSTLVVWGGEFGRTPDTNEAQHKKNLPGRDHNPSAMTMWFAGGGVKGGTIVGATDEVGEKAAVDRHHLKNVHATLLHIMGLDQEELSYYHGGRLKRLTDNGGEIIESILA